MTNNNRRTGPLFRIFGRYADVTDEGTLESPSPGENQAGVTGTRTFPDLAQVLAGHTNAKSGHCPKTHGRAHLAPRVLNCYSEFLPVQGYVGTAGSRRPAMHFRLTARDGRPGGGGIAHDDVTLRLDSHAGPFLVSSFGDRDEHVDGGSRTTIRWQVNRTRRLARHVQILLSTDGGATWDHVLAESTKNDGRARVQIPAVPTSDARIMISAIDNYFFDINDRAFRIR